MLFVKMFMEYGVLFALFLLLEILIPMGRSNPLFPTGRWIGRKLHLLPQLPTRGGTRY
jgi:hypothetical protein